VRNDGRRKDISELAKYTVKDVDFIKPADDALTDRLVSVLSKALRGRRLNAFGGVLKLAAAKLKLLDENENEDLVHTGDDETVREDVAVIMRFFWRFGISQYVKVNGDKKRR